MKKCLSGSKIKIIAATTMLTDHMAIILNRYGCIPAVLYDVMRAVGRLAFPLFTFLMVEGFMHTKSVRKYIIRLAAFAIISEIPFDMLNYGRIWNAGHNNILLTFVISVCVLWAVSRFIRMGKKGTMLMFPVTAIGMAAAFFMKTDYSWRGVLLSVVFYVMHDYKAEKYITAALVLVMSGSLLSFAALLSLVIIDMYDGKRGKLPKYVMYAFYPLHLLVLGLVGMPA
ncbi:MAG: TraX family protein [Butyrivibrio sp.]